MLRRGRRTPRGLRRRGRSSRVAAPAARSGVSNSHGDDDSVIVIEDDDDDCTTIDLTGDESTPVRQNADSNEVIDLTSPVADPPIVVGRSTRMRRSPRNQPRTTIVSSDSDSDDLPELNYPCITPEKSKKETASSSSVLPQESPTSQMLTCPVCLDDYKAIKASKRQIFSTICGHIFCNECIEASIRSQSRCPTCRKKLTLSKTHPLFLG